MLRRIRLPSRLPPISQSILDVFIRSSNLRPNLVHLNDILRQTDMILNSRDIQLTENERMLYQNKRAYLINKINELQLVHPTTPSPKEGSKRKGSSSASPKIAAKPRAPKSAATKSSEGPATKPITNYNIAIRVRTPEYREKRTVKKMSSSS